MSEALAGLRPGARASRAEPAEAEAKPGDLFELRYRGDPVSQAEAREAVRSQVVAKGLRRLLDRGSQG